MMIDENKAQLKENLENGTAEANFRALGLSDEQVEDCMTVCKRAFYGYYGDDIFSPESNIYFKLLHIYQLQQ